MLTRRLTLIILLIAVILSIAVRTITMSSATLLPKSDAVSSIYEYDLIVIGGEPEGISTAISAARNNGKVLLLEKRDGLGGLMTYGMLNTIDMNRTPDKELLTKGIFEEFYKEVNDHSFDVKEVKEIFTSMVNREKNIDLVLDIDYWYPIMSESKDEVIGVKYIINGKLYKHYGLRIIDATQDAEIAYLAGVPFYEGWEDLNQPKRRMAVTLVLHVDGVDWSKAGELYDRHKDDYIEVYKNSVAGFGKTVKGYKPLNPNTRLRGLNIGRQNDGTVLINALQIFGIDGITHESKQRAMDIGTEEAFHVIEFLSQEVPAFKNARLIGVAPELYIRETRHMIGEYMLDIADIINCQDFEDKIAIGAYPVDIQATEVTDHGFVIYDPVMYGIPFRCLVPKKIDNILVVGRSASYSALAHGSARVIPIGMVAGESAGAAAIYSIKNNISFRDLAYDKGHMENLIEILRKQGVHLQDINVEQEKYQHWAYQYILSLSKVLRINMGYIREFNYDADVTTHTFIFDKRALLLNYGKNQHAEILGNASKGMKNSKLTYNDILDIVSKTLQQEVLSFEQLRDDKIISNNLYERIQSCQQPNRAIQMGIAVEVSNWIRENK